MQATRTGSTETQTQTTALGRPTAAYVPAERPFQPLYGDPSGQPTTVVVGMPQAAYGVAVGLPGAGVRLAAGTVLRGGLIGLGFYLAGVRGWKPLVLGSLASSATLSLLLAGHHAIASRRSW